MAIVGLAYLAIAPFPKDHVAGTIPKYTGGIVGARLVQANLTYERSETTLEEDNVTTESDNAITGGNLSFGSGHFTDEARKMAFGLMVSKDESDVEVLDTTAGLPPYVGVGFILSEQVNGVESHLANIVWKTQFAPQGVNAQTKGKQKTFQTVTASGKFMGVQINQNDPTFLREARFKTPGEAQAWINGYLGVTATEQGATQATE